MKFQFDIFQSYILEFGVDALNRPYMRVVVNGAYVTEAPTAVSAVSLTNPAIVTDTASGYATADWLYATGFGGTTELNGRTLVARLVAGNNITLGDTFGNPINALAYGAYTDGGTLARIYTNFSTPYAVEDLPYLKVVQSADVMSLCCVNQSTGAEYPPIDLSRLAANNWSFVDTTFASAIAAPTGCAATTTITGSPATQYAYCVTAVDAVTGEESVASNIAYITNSDDTAVVAGSHTITWDPVAGAGYYNIYQAPPSYDTPVPVGSVFGYLGTSYGNTFVNTNIQADLTVTPPLHNNPFAQSTILSVGVIPQTGTFAQATTTAVINTATGSDGVIIPVVTDGGGTVVAGIVQDGGELYGPTDTVTFTDSGTGDVVIAPLNIGPATGTFPSVPNYFQARRVYANTLNNPDTLFFSQTGAYQNMDASTPPVDSDAIITTPWGQQVNGIQWMQPMPGGLIAATGDDAWQLSGAGGAGSTLTPASQSAQPQESNGFSPTVMPLRINFDIVYNQSYGYVIRDLQYNFFVNIYAGEDISVLSNQLFDGFEITQWDWAKVPWKLIWAARSDGKFLSCTFDKEEKLKGWSRHDTNGLVAGIAVATEPPVDAPYFVVKRYIVGYQQWYYFIERMDDRFWNGPEDPFCIDAGLALAMPTPNATLSAAAAEGPGNISGGYLPAGGLNYTAPSAQINDPAGTGSGGSITFSLTGGVITGFVIVPGQNYSPGTTVKIVDETGAGATFVPLISQNVLFTASAAVFANNNPGDVIRIGGGQASVTTINSPTQVLAAIVAPILQTMPDDPNNLPVPAASGNWSITTPITEVTNLYHLEGMQVTGLADGQVIPLMVVENGSITLAQAASNIKVGLPFIAQLQSMPTEIPQLGSIQGERKRITGATIRVQASRGYQLFANQPVAAALDYQQEIPWMNPAAVPAVPSVGVPDAALPLFTGDLFVNIDDDWQSWDGFTASMGMIAAQQLNPQPLSVLALVPHMSLGDNKDQG